MKPAFPDSPNLGAIAATMDLGVLPQEGGLLDQPADFVDELMEALEERANMLDELKEKKHGR